MKYYAILATDRSGPALGIGITRELAWADHIRTDSDRDLDALSCYEISHISYLAILNGNPDAVEIID